MALSRRGLLGLGLLVWVPGCKRDAGLSVFAAASLREAVGEVCQRFGERESCKVSTNYAGSNVLARQIESSRAADVYISADTEWMGYLEVRELLEPGTRHELLSNQLVVVARKGKIEPFTDPEALVRVDFDRLVLADPEAVPAGRYAKSWLSSKLLRSGTLWDALKAKVVPAGDVRAALGAVAADPRRVGIVYATDAAVEPSLRILYRVPVKEGPQIRYHIAQIRGARNPERAKAFLQYTGQAEARDVFHKFGFIVPP